MKHRYMLFIAVLCCIAPARAQDVDSLLGSIVTPPTDYTIATFKASRVVIGQSIEQMRARQMDFRIHHRFGLVNSGSYEMWGLDQASTFLGLEYGITDWLMLGVGRSTYQKAYNVFTKFRLWRQATGERAMPIAVSLYTGFDINTLKSQGTAPTLTLAQRASYIAQLIVARKVTEELSLQIAPAIVHRNLVATVKDKNDLLAFGFAGRYKIANRISLNAEYYLVPTHDAGTGEATYNPLSFGVDIETGGHVFQIMLTNALPMIERGFITETTSSWRDGGIHLGFNISRVFTL